jgi:hypothetical protein
LLATLGTVLVSCASSEKSGRGGDQATTTTGGAGTQGGSGGTSQGGASPGSGGSGAGNGGSAGLGGGGSAGNDAAGAGGQDDGAGTVTGVVRTDAGSPNDGVLVAIGSEFTYTDLNGRFEIVDVPPEYDIVFIIPTQKNVVVIRGLSERALSVRLPGNETNNLASVTGVLTGGVGVPIPPDCWAETKFVDPESRAYTFEGPTLGVDPSDASYDMFLSWPGAENISGSLFAIEYRRDAMLRPISVLGFGSTPIDLSGGSNVGMRDGSTPATTIALEPVDSRTVSGRIIAPPGFYATLDFYVGPFTLVGASATGDTYSILLPTGLGSAPITISMQAQSVRGPDDYAFSYASFPVGDSVTTLDVSVGTPATSILPEEGATVDYDTRFSWDPPADSVSTLVLEFNGWYVSIVTEESSTSIPDLTQYGFSQMPGSEGAWWIDNAFMTSVDELLKPTSLGSVTRYTSGFRRTYTFAN